MAAGNIGVPRPGGLAGAHAGLQQVLALLTSPSPEVLALAAAVLHSVVAEMPSWRKAPGIPAAAQRGEIEHIRELAARAAILLAKAETYHAGWIACLGSLTGGYRAGGAPAPLPSTGRLWAEG